MRVFTFMGIADVALGAGLVIAGILVSGDARVPLLAVGGGLIPFGLVFFVVGRRLGPVAGVAPGWTAEGIPAEAAIEAVRETGVTINDRPLVGFDLQVRPRNEHPYQATVRQVVPVTMLGAALPGRSVAVLIHPGDRNRVAIDWSRLPQPATPEPASPTTRLDAVPEERRHSASKLLATGRRGRGKITAMRRVGELADLGLAAPGDEGWEDDLFHITLEVKLPGFDPIEAQVLHRVPDRLVGRVGPGLEVEVAADRDDPSHQVAIDWDALEI